MTRREASGALAAVFAGGSARGANDRVNLALVGCGGRGRYVAGLMLQAQGAAPAVFCDVYPANAEAARQKLGPDAAVEKDFRRVLERKDVDALLVATPDHWHAAIAVLAIQAGKHVYIEKPLSWSVREGQAIVAAARQSKCVVQPGTQHRSAPHIAEAARIVQSGELGAVHYVRVWNYVNMDPLGIGKEPDSDPPAGLDWDFYCGPAPLVPFNRKRFLSTYRWFWDYSGGYITDYGTHRFDTVHQIMNASAPVSISAAGRRFRLQDSGQMPDILQVSYEYPGFVMSYEACNLNGHGMGGRTPGMRYYNARGPEDRPHGMAFYGTGGALFVDRIGYELYPEEAGGSWPPPRVPAKPEYRTEARRKQGADATALHARAFVDAIRNGTPPPADVEAGHRATSIGLLGNIAFKTGLKLRWDPARQDFQGQPAATALLARRPRKPWNLI